MDRVQKLDYQKSMEEYFHTHKVNELLENLFEELIVNKPKNPIDYLISRLKRKPVKRIFITGNPGTDVGTTGLALANSLGYKCVDLSQLIENEISNLEKTNNNKKNFMECRYIDDEFVINILRNELIKCEEENISYIVLDFPRNRTQAIFLKSYGLLPDNVILLKTSREKSLESIKDKIKNNYEKEEMIKNDEEINILANISLDEFDINLKALKDSFNGFYQEINIDEYEDKDYDIIDILSNLIKFKIRANETRNPPHILLIAPPCYNKGKIGKIISNRLKIAHVDVMDLLKKEIEAKNENSKNILEALDKNENVDNKYVLKFLEDKLYSSDCSINGWIITGFPKSELQINYIENMKSQIKPNLIVLIDADERKIEENANKKRYDPLTGKSYIEGSEEYAKLGEDELSRLAKRKQDEGEILMKRIESFKNVADIINKRDFKNLIKFSGSESENQIIETIIDKIGFKSENES